MRSIEPFASPKIYTRKMLFKAAIIDKFSNHTLNEAYLAINDAIAGVQKCYLESYK